MTGHSDQPPVTTPAARLIAAARTLDRLPKIALTARERRGLSVRAAARQIGCSFSTLSRIETGAIDTRIDIAKAVLRWAARKD